MDVPLEGSTRSNTKSDHDSESELPVETTHKNEAPLEALRSSEDTSPNDSTFADNGHLDKDDEDEVQDPLQEKICDIEIKAAFQWEFNEDEFLISAQEAADDSSRQAANGRNKRLRAVTQLKGRNGQLWSRTPPEGATTGDISDAQATGMGPARTVSNPLESWHLLVDAPILMQVVKHTNEVIRLFRGRREAHQRRCTDLVELRAWLGLNYLCGVLRNAEHAGPLEELWTLELGNAIFRATMSYKRFVFLGECLRLSEARSKRETPVDSVASLWDKFIINCRSYYAPSGYCALNEFTVDNATENGLRVVSLCDAKTLFVCNALTSSGAQPVEEETYKLVCDIKGSERCVCLDACHTTVNLLKTLGQRQLRLVTSLSSSAKEIPLELLSTKTCQVWHSENTTLISGVPKDVTPTGLLLACGLSSRINVEKLFQTTNQCKRRAQLLTAVYSTSYVKTAFSPLGPRWPLQFFWFMLDIAAFNAWILLRLSECGDAGIEQRDFQRQLGLYLTQQQLKLRLQANVKLPLPLKLQIAEILGEPVDSLLLMAATKLTQAQTTGTIPADKVLIPAGVTLMTRLCETRRRCRKCHSRNGSKARTRCQQCLVPFCPRHLIARCEECTGVQQVPQEARSNNDGTVSSE